jgi:hypothetical protein
MVYPQVTVAKDEDLTCGSKTISRTIGLSLSHTNTHFLPSVQAFEGRKWSSRGSGHPKD